MGVERSHVQPIAQDREPAVHGTAADRDGEVRRQRPSIRPDRPSRSRVERPRLVVVAGHVRDAVYDERGILETAPRKSRHVGLKQPLRREPRDVGRRDLRQRTVPLARVVTGKRRPVGRLFDCSERQEHDEKYGTHKLFPYVAQTFRSASRQA